MQNNGENYESTPDSVQIYLQGELEKYTEERIEAEKTVREASIHIIKLKKALDAYNEPYHKSISVNFPLAEKI